MEIMEALGRMEEIERKASQFYKKNHQRFSQDPEASRIFYWMHIEENGHVNLTQYVRKLVTENPELFNPIDYEATDFDKIIAALDRELSRKKGLTLEETLDFAVNIEIVLSEGYLAHLPPKSNPIIHDLYLALGESDHLERIAAFRKKRTGR